MASLTAISHLVQVHAQLDELRQKLNVPKIPLTNEAIMTIGSQLQPLYKKLLLANLDDAVSRQLELGLWGDCFKAPLTRFGRTDKALFHFMIESGVGFYLGLIQDIGVHFDISFITNTTSTNKLYCTKTSQSPLVSPSKASVYFIIQNCLLHVGDLLRYQGSFPEACKMYEKSASVCPSNGFSFHQMGVTQLLIPANDEYTIMNNFVSSFFYHARALSVSNPHLQSYHAFDAITAKILAMPVGTNKYQEFVRQFLLMISSVLRKDMLPSSFTSNLVPMLSPLVANQQIKPSILFQMLCIAMWTQWRLLYSEEGECSRNEEAILEIIAAIFNAILIASVGIFGDHYFAHNKNTPDRRIASTVHVKFVIDWLVRLYRNDKAVKQVRFFREKTHMSNLVKVLNLINATTHDIDLEDVVTTCNFILPEERRLIGFLPLDYTSLRTIGTILLGDNDPQTQSYRLYRLMQTAPALSQPHTTSSSFTDSLSISDNFKFYTFDGAEFGEATTYNSGCSPSALPSRRNVALTSIFRSGLASLGGGEGGGNNNFTSSVSTPSFEFGDGNSSFCSSGGVGGGISPSNSTASLSPMALPYVSNLNNSFNSSGGNYFGLGTRSKSSSSDPFRSIWTPNDEKKATNNDCSAAWN